MLPGLSLVFSLITTFVIVGNERWQIACRVAGDSDLPHHISFVNSLATPRGGTHVNNISDKIAKRLLDHMESIGKKNDLSFTLGSIKSSLVFIVFGHVPNPSFDSQTKEQLMTPAAVFEKDIPITEKFLKELINGSGIVDVLISAATLKQKSQLARSSKSKQQSKLQLPVKLSGF